MSMATSPVAGRLLIAVMVVVVLLLADAAGEPAGATEDVQYRRYRRIHHRDAPPRTPTTPPVQPVRPVHPAPPPPPSCNDTFAGEEFPTASGDVCTPVPAPTPVVVPPPRGVLQCPPCRCSCPAPKPQPLPLPQPPRPFPGWSVPVPGRGGSNGGAGSGDGYCVMALAPMMTCGRFLTAANGTETETPTPVPTDDCCSGLAAFLRTSGAAAAAGRGDGTLQCLCPFILGDVNKTLQKPIDPVKMMYLPVACGIILPPELLFVSSLGGLCPR